MTADVIAIPTLADIPVEKVLEGARSADLCCVLVLGFDEEGELFAAASTGRQATNIHLIELFKHNLLSGNLGAVVSVRPRS